MPTLHGFRLPHFKFLNYLHKNQSNFRCMSFDNYLDKSLGNYQHNRLHSSLHSRPYNLLYSFRCMQMYNHHYKLLHSL